MAAPKSPRGRRLLIGFAVTIGVLGVVLSGLWAFQRKLIFLPDADDPGPAAQYFATGQDVSFVTDDGLTLSALLVRPPGKDSATAVLLAPGNAGNRAGRAGLITELTERGFTVLALDYRGYGGNPGSPSEEGLAADARAAAQFLAGNGFPLTRTIYLGESLGCAVVARLAQTHPPAGILLRSPFTSLVDTAKVHYPFLPVSWLLRDRFTVTERIAGLQVPLTVVYGTADTIVPPEQSAAVADTAPTLHERLVLDGVGHNDPEMFGAPIADAVLRLPAAPNRG